MNPWAIIVVLVLLASYFGGHHQGYKAGVNEQSVADQKLINAANSRTQGIIDGYNQQIAEQKATAASKAIDQRDQVIALQAERDKFKNQLGEQHVKNQDATNRLHDVYAAYSLRFRAEPESTGCGYGAGPCESAEGSSARNATAAVVQLPTALAADLRRLAKDADELNDDYKLCYGYAQEVAPVKRE
jgi:hypothetical protein